MRLKTFIAIYLLLLIILFSSVGIVSIYLTNSQIDMLRNKSAGQFQAVVHSLVRDVTVMWGRFDLQDAEFSNAVYELVRSYARYYNRHNVHLSISDLTLMKDESGSITTASEITFVNHSDGYFIYISGLLPLPFDQFLLNYSLDITQNIGDMREIQNVLLISVVIFSIIAAFALHLILLSIFRPLNVIARASRVIADGRFGERIQVTGKNELAQVAYDFNKMAERIEVQMLCLEEESENKQQFVDNLAHEIRTPLTSILGYAQYIQKAPLNEEEIIESAEYIMTEASHMSTIANSLLELATLRTYIPTKSEILVTELFADISQALEKSLHEHGVNLSYNIETDILYGQEDLVRSLLLNLCTNAIKVCKKGEGEIYLDAKQDSSYTVITVTDNGCGIPKDSLDRVYEPFYRIDKSRSREYGGTGLGLTLCKQIAEAHRAEMSVESTIGIGTRIKIKFTTF